LPLCAVSFTSGPSLEILFVVIVFFFPAIYYVTHVEVHFRRQINPLNVALAVCGVLPENSGAPMILVMNPRVILNWVDS